MLTSIVILLLFYSINFLWEIDDHLLQTKYDWNHVEQIKRIGKVALDSVSYNFVRLKVPENYQTDCNNSFLLSDINKKPYYFRAVYSFPSQGYRSFYGVEWLIKKPSNKASQYLFTEVKIPFTQKGVKSVVTIGDAYLSENNAKYFRINIAGKAPVYFKGQKRDVFNYPHWADKNYSIDSIVNVSKKVEYADYYILLFNNGNEGFDLTKLQQIKYNLLSKNPKKIFWLLLPGETEIQRKNNQSIEALSDDKTLIINIDRLLNKQDIYLDKHTVLSKEAYIKISNAIAKFIDD